MTSTPLTTPTIVLLQGSFQLPDVYSKFTEALQAKGYSVIHPSFQSLSDPDKPDFASKSLSDDALAAEAVLRHLIEGEARHVVVVSHSYGGLVGSEAVSEELTYENRKQRDLRGGVVHIVFFAAFILAEGDSVLSVFGEPPTNETRPGGRFRIKDAAKLLYDDLPGEEAEYWAERIIDQSYAVQTTKLTRAAYRYVPSTYVVCERDQALPPTYQEMFAENAGAAVLRIAAGHSPMLSRTDELADTVVTTARKAMENVS